MSPGDAPAWHHRTAAEIAAAVRAGHVTAVEVTDHFLERIAALEKDLGAFLHVDADGARAAAAEVDRRRAAGDDPGPLAGVPLAVKDNLHVAGLPTTCASRILDGWIPPFESTVVTRARRAGCVVVGKTNMDEFAMGSSCEHSAFGPTRNPWDPERTPGGSSGGSAAAVAAGLVPVALGSDTGGSIRQPAALCGVTGFKSTWGRTSRFGLTAFASSLDQVGPLARTAEDCALVQAAIGGRDPRDATTDPDPDGGPAAALAPALAEPRPGDPRPVIGVPPEVFEEGIAPDVEQRFREALERLARLGCDVRETPMPHARVGIAAYYLVATAEASSNLARYDGVRYGLRRGGDGDLAEMYTRTRSAGFGPEVRRRILLGTHGLSAGRRHDLYDRALRVRDRVRRDLAESGADVIVTPTSPTVAFPLGERLDDPVAMYRADVYTVPANLAGTASVSVPCGAGDAGLPVGLQFTAAARDGDATVLALARAWQDAGDHHARLSPMARRDVRDGEDGGRT